MAGSAQKGYDYVELPRTEASRVMFPINAASVKITITLLDNEEYNGVYDLQFYVFLAEGKQPEY